MSLFILGIFVGGALGVILLSLLMMASRSDRVMNEEYKSLKNKKNILDK